MSQLPILDFRLPIEIGSRLHVSELPNSCTWIQTQRFGLWTLNLGPWTFNFEPHYAQRSSLRRSNVSQEPRLHGRGGADAGTRDWREHGDLQRGQCRSPSSLALSAAGSTGYGMEP